MIKPCQCLFIAILASQWAFSQTKTIEAEHWVDKPTLFVVKDPYTRESAVIVLDSRRYEYIDNEKKDVEEYYTFHRIIHLNDDRAIEMFNKIYLGFGESSEVLEVKARAILPDGKIMELDKSNIKDLKEQDGNTYKIFALEGLQKGSDIEYYYTMKIDPSFFGRDVFQSKNPVLKSRMEIIAPERLQFEFKGYNCSAAVTDTVLDNKRRFICEFSNIPAAEEEKYASYDANLMRLEYKLSYNTSFKGERLFTWNELAKKMYAAYSDVSADDQKKAADLVKKEGWEKLRDETSEIMAAENFLKINFAYDESYNGEESGKITKIIQTKRAGTVGIMRLYGAVMKALNINYQFVLTSDRDKYVIDREFENWDNCEYPILYFPGEQKYLAPTRPDLRYPIIAPSWGATNALFCKSMSIGNFSTAIAEIKPVTLEDYRKTYSRIESKISFDKNLDSLTIDAKQIFGGYSAASYRDIFNFSTADDRQQAMKDLAKRVSASEHMIFSETKNQEFGEKSADSPVVFHCITKSPEMIENAGNKILLKIGLAIGPQIEMYQEKPRWEPVSVEYPQIEERTIEFVIPDGYIVKNPQDLNISQQYTNEGELTMGFVSSYAQAGNLLSIHIMEEYRKTFYPISQFEEFKKIINASSDFNKVVLVLEKK